MARLTEQVGTVNSGKPIIDPGREGPSFVEGLANFASNAIPGAVKLVEERRAETAAGVLDEAAGRIFEIQTGGIPEAASNVLSPSSESLRLKVGLSSDAAPAVASDVKSAVDEVVRAQKGVSQGRVAQASYDLQLERMQADLFQKYPEQRAEIAAYIQSRGIDHYMFRAFNAEDAAVENEEKAQAAADAYQYQAAAEAGLVTSSTSLSEGARIGRLWIGERQRQAAAIAQREAAIADRRLSLEEQEASRKQTAGDVGASLINQFSISFDPVVQQVATAVNAAGDDPARQAVLGDYRTRTATLFAQYESRGIAQITAAGGNIDDVKAFQTFVQSQRDSLDALYTTTFETNAMVVRNFESAFRLTSAQALPMYSRVVSMIGQPAANALFSDVNGMMQLAPNVMESVKQELMNIDPTTDRGVVSLARAVAFMRGETQFKDLTAEQATEFLRMNNRAVVASQQAVISGNVAQLPNWMAQYGNTSEAVAELNTVGTDIRQMHTATGVLANPGARRALDIARREDPELGAALTQASRAGSAKLLGMALRQRPENQGLYVIRTNADGMYEAAVSTEAYNRAKAEYDRRVPDEVWNDQLGTYETVVQRPFPTIETIRRNLPSEMRNWVDVANTNITHLVETDQYDPAVDNAQTPRQRRDAYARGAGPARKQVADGSTARDEFDVIVRNLDATLDTMSTGIATSAPPAPEDRAANMRGQRNLYDTVLGHGQYGEPPKPITSMTIGEAINFGRETLIPATRGRAELGLGGTDLGSSAVGAYQFTQGTLADFGPRVLGENWRNEPMSPANQERLAEAIFNDSKGSAEALASRWASLTLAEAERVRRMPWSEARQYIVEGEAGGRFQGEP